MNIIISSPDPANWESKWREVDHGVKPYISEVNIEQHCNSVIGIGSLGWTRTNDQRINSPTLYQLSYQGTEKKTCKVRATKTTCPRAA